MTTIIVKSSPMADDAREKMILGAVRLLATTGLEGVSFSTVLELTGAPRGSIYHHFPEGKNQLIGLALQRAGQYLLTAMETPPPKGAIEAAEHFFAIWRKVLLDSNFQAGCAVLAYRRHARARSAQTGARRLQFLAEPSDPAVGKGRPKARPSQDDGYDHDHRRRGSDGAEQSDPKFGTIRDDRRHASRSDHEPRSLTQQAQAC